MPVYEQPYVGQVFKRVQNEDRTEYGYCTGVGTFGAGHWTATIGSGVVSQVTRIYQNQEYGHTDWMPLKGQELAELRGAAVLGDMVDKATFLELVKRFDASVRWAEEMSAKTALLEKHIDSLQARLDARDTPTPPPPPPPAETNGREPRVRPRP